MARAAVQVQMIRMMYIHSAQPASKKLRLYPYTSNGEDNPPDSSTYQRDISAVRFIE